MNPAFSRVVGQASAIDYLSRALAAGRLAHGLLFAGPVGVGRRTTAEALAAVWLADRSADPRSVDTTAKLIAAQTHPDYHYVFKELIRGIDKTGKSKATTLSIDVTRQYIIEPSYKRPLMGRGKVFVVEDADLMQREAQNALLKTLEEPAGRTLIVLISEQPASMLSTIRSRTQLVRFGRLGREEAMEVLRRQGTEPGPVQAALDLADNSPGLALRWIEDGYVGAVPEFLRLLGGGDLASFLKSSADAIAEKALDRDELTSEDNHRRIAIATWMRIAADHYRRRLVAEVDDARRADLIDRITRARRAEMYVDSNVGIGLVTQYAAALAYRESEQ